MEKAYLITQNSDFKKLENSLGNYQRLYFWDAYCEYNLFYFLDNENFIKKILSYNLPLTFTTPIISNKNIDKLINFIEKYKNLAWFEVVVNDYWVFYYLKKNYPEIKLIWWNFLSGQSKDPFLKIFKDKETHKKLTIDNDFYRDFFEKNKISGVEIYNVFQWLELNNDYNLSIYYPYVVYSINRYCPTKLAFENKNYLTIVEDCSWCKGKNPPNFNLNLKMKEDFSANFFRWNKQFYENQNLIEDKKINRIIYNYDLVW